MAEKPRPQIPPGRGNTILSTISQSLAFHSSPDSFLSQYTDSSASQQTHPILVRARILNRDVIIISSYAHCREILGLDQKEEESDTPAGQQYISAMDHNQALASTSFGVLPAYKDLMIDFFPAPNLLLTDAAAGHRLQRRNWDSHMSEVCRHSSSTLRQIAMGEISEWRDGAKMDLYDRMKDLSWRMLLSVFLHLNPADEAYSQVVSWQETLLRGQFSMLPVSISTPFWRSARSHGLDSRRRLQDLLERTIVSQHPECPFHHGEEHSISQQELASNALLFTSSIAVKALASLLTATLLNMYFFPGNTSLATHLRDLDADRRGTLLQSILRETERLSPPVIGVMRRVQQDVALHQSSDAECPETLVPAGWDAWLYFVGAARNEAVYPQAAKFVPERFTAEAPPPPSLTFGHGEKTCLGRDITRQIIQTVVTVMLDSGIDLHGTVDSKGVHAWLGWDDEVSVEEMSKDLKQLPCQRPRKPIKVRVRRNT